MSTISTVIKKKFLKSLKIDLFHLFEEYILRLRKSQTSKTNKRIKNKQRTKSNGPLSSCQLVTVAALTVAVVGKSFPSSLFYTYSREKKQKDAKSTKQKEDQNKQQKNNVK